jgi:hypothetical protein
MQRASIFTSGSWRHDAAQWSQASAHALQASMQDLNGSWGMAFLLGKMKLPEQETGSRMAVPVMRIRVMPVRMRQDLVPVRMRVAGAGRERRLVGMAMVLVVLVLVRVLERLVRMAMRMALAQVQPDAGRHEQRGNEKGDCHAFAE